MHEAARYEATAAVVRGEQILPNELRSLARWISDAYSVDVVNVIVDALDDGRARLCVWLRTSAQRREFRDGGNHDPARQSAVADRARHELSSSDTFLVIFEDFEARARERAMALPSGELETLRARLAGELLWSIKVGWGRAVFFVHTDEEVEQFREGSEFRRWSGELLAAMRPRDEVDILELSPPVFELDSRERFERDFAGSGYFYFL